MSQLTVYFTVEHLSKPERSISQTYYKYKYSFPTKAEAEAFLKQETDRIGARTYDTWYECSFYHRIVITEENHGLPDGYKNNL